MNRFLAYLPCLLVLSVVACGGAVDSSNVNSGGSEPLCSGGSGGSGAASCEQCTIPDVQLACMALDPAKTVVFACVSAIPPGCLLLPTSGPTECKGPTPDPAVVACCDP